LFPLLVRFLINLLVDVPKLIKMSLNLNIRFFIKYYLFSTLTDKGNMNYFDVLGGNSLLSAKYEFVRHLSLVVIIGI
jgi:hypothetical protein